MHVRVPRRFIEDFFRALYHHIVPHCDLLGGGCAVVLEPIYVLTGRTNTIAEWRLVDEYINPEFNILDQRDRITNGLLGASSSNLEQILVRVDTDVCVLWDNPLEFPGERLARFIEILPSAPEVAGAFSGICHFHPTESAAHGEDDRRTIRRIVSEVAQYGPDQLTSIIMARGHAAQYVKEGMRSQNDFVASMMAHLDEVQFEAWTLWAKGKEEFRRVVIS